MSAYGKPEHSECRRWACRCSYSPWYVVALGWLLSSLGQQAYESFMGWVFSHVDWAAVVAIVLGRF